MGLTVECGPLKAKLSERGCEINQRRARATFDIIMNSVISTDFMERCPDGDIAVMLGCMMCPESHIGLDTGSIDELLAHIVDILNEAFDAIEGGNNED